MAAKKKIIRTAGPEIDWSEYTPDHENYTRCSQIVSEWLRAEWSGDNGTKKAKEEAIFWFTNTNRTADAAAAEEVPAWRFHYYGKLYYAMNNGAILKKKSMAWLEENMAPLLETGYEEVKRMAALAEADTKTTKPVIDPKIVEEMAGRTLASNLEDLILTGKFGNEMNIAFDVLKANSPKPGVLKAAIMRIQEFVDELTSLSPDEIEEGFPNRETHNEAKIVYSELLRIATTFMDNAATRRKATRKRKVKKFSKEGRAIKDVAKMKVMAEYSTLNLVGVPLEKMVGAKGVMVYNTKDRKVGIYRAKDDEGIQVKGTTIKDFDEERSGQKILRKPEIQIESLRKVTLRRAEVIMRDNINAKMASVTGRLNGHMIVIAAWK